MDNFMSNNKTGAQRYNDRMGKIWNESMEAKLKWDTVRAMETYGGSFVKALAFALQKADHIKFKKLKQAFPKYWKQYEEMAKRK